MQATVSSEVQQTTDSTSHETATAQLERMVAQVTATATDLLLFDTDKPADPATQLHPLKAVLHQQAATGTRQHEQSATQREAQQRVETAKEVQVQASATGKRQTATVAGSSAGKWTDALLGTLGCVTGLVLSLIAIYVILKLKRKANE